MKLRHIILFIVGVLGGLALLCTLFPAEGVDVLDAHLRFPGLAEVLGGKDVPDTLSLTEEEPEDTLVDLTPEELLEQRLQALDAKQMEEFMRYCNTNSARLYMPDDDSSYLDAFFARMENAQSQHLRIMHYGDSQIECDRITSLLRQEFQETFGGCGVGLIPALQTVPTFTSSIRITPDDVPQYLPYGPQEKRGDDTFYGPMAKTTHITDGATIELAGIGGKDYAHSRSFNRLTVLTQGPAQITLLPAAAEKKAEADTLDTAEPQGTLLTGEASGDMYFYRATTGRMSQARLQVDGEARILGIQLDGTTGISVDNLPMRGCSGNELLRISRASLTPFFRHENVGLVILQYGGNAIPYLTREKLKGFKENVKRTVSLFRELEPDAKILFIGPSDMSKNEEGEMITYPILPEAVKAIREGANEAGAAFWNMYAAMGGNGSMVRWVEAEPQLAGADYIHFTPLGAKKVAHMLYETLQFYYRFYKFRTEPPVEEAATDTLQTQE